MMSHDYAIPTDFGAVSKIINQQPSIAIKHKANLLFSVRLLVDHAKRAKKKINNKFMISMSIAIIKWKPQGISFINKKNGGKLTCLVTSDLAGNDREKNFYLFERGRLSKFVHRVHC